LDEELKKLIEKLNSLEQITQEEIDLISTHMARQEVEAEEAKKEDRPVRKIQFSDNPKNESKSIDEIVKGHSRFLTDAEKEVQSLSDDIYITSILTKRNPRELNLYQKTFLPFLGRYGELRKAMDTATATEGLEWIPTTLSTNLIEKYRLQARVPGLFTEIAMPRNPYKLPTSLGDMTFYLIPESKTSEPSKTPTTKLTTGDLTLTAQKLRARSIWSEELDEESIIPVLPAVKNNIAKSAALAVEDAILNGDTTATHMDSDVTDSKDHRKIWKGLRKHAMANSWSVDLSTFDKDTTRSLLTKMKKYGIIPSDVTWITGVVCYNKMRGLTELLTVDKYGPAATILTGEVGKLYGSPVIISEKTREDLHTTGYYTGSTGYTELTVVNRGAFLIGNRGNWRLTVDFDNDVDQYVLNVRFKKDFIPIYDVTAEPIVAIGYKIS